MHKLHFPNHNNNSTHKNVVVHIPLFASTYQFFHHHVFFSLPRSFLYRHYYISVWSTEKPSVPGVHTHYNTSRPLVVGLQKVDCWLIGARALRRKVEFCTLLYYTTTTTISIIIFFFIFFCSSSMLAQLPIPLLVLILYFLIIY